MNMDSYQVAAHATAVYPEYIGLMYTTLGLTGEAGELANKVKKIYRDDNGILTIERRGQLAKELGGVLWYVAEICTVLGIKLSDVAEANARQLADRADRGVIGGSGDDR